MHRLDRGRHAARAASVQRRPPTAAASRSGRRRRAHRFERDISDHVFVRVGLTATRLAPGSCGTAHCGAPRSPSRARYARRSHRSLADRVAPASTRPRRRRCRRATSRTERDAGGPRPAGIPEARRGGHPEAPAAERVRDWQPIYLRARGRGRQRAGRPLHGLRRRVLPQRLPAGQPDPRVERVRRPRRLDDGASERLHATNNFPEFTGWICPAPCEAACVLALNTDPVTIKQVEVSIVERAFDDGLVEPQPPLERTGTRGRRRRLGAGRPGRGPAAHPRRARGDRLRARRPPRRPAALRHPRLQDAQGHHRPADRRRWRPRARCSGSTPTIGPPTSPRLRAEFDAVVLAVGALAPRELTTPGPRPGRRAPGDDVPAAGQPGAGRRHRRRRRSTPRAST